MKQNEDKMKKLSWEELREGRTRKATVKKKKLTGRDLKAAFSDFHKKVIGVTYREPLQHLWILLDGMKDIPLCELFSSAGEDTEMHCDNKDGWICPLYNRNTKACLDEIMQIIRLKGGPGTFETYNLLKEKLNNIRHKVDDPYAIVGEFKIEEKPEKPDLKLRPKLWITKEKLEKDTCSFEELLEEMEEMEERKEFGLSFTSSPDIIKKSPQGHRVGSIRGNTFANTYEAHAARYEEYKKKALLQSVQDKYSNLELNKTVVEPVFSEVTGKAIGERRITRIERGFETITQMYPNPMEKIEELLEICKKASYKRPLISEKEKKKIEELLEICKNDADS